MTFKPGQITNPSGSIRTKPFSDALRALLSRDCDDPLADKPKTKVQEIALALMKKANEGDINAIREIVDRVEGKAAQSLEVKKVDPFEELSTEDVIGLIQAVAGAIESGSIPSETSSSKKKTRAIQAVH